MLANKNLARRVAVTGLDKSDGTVLNARIRGLLVADLCKLFQYRKEKGPPSSGFCLGREKPDQLFKAAQRAHRWQAASVLAKPHSKSAEDPRTGWWTFFSLLFCLCCPGGHQFHFQGGWTFTYAEKPAFQRLCFLNPSPGCFNLWKAEVTNPCSADARCCLEVLFSVHQNSFSFRAGLSILVPNPQKHREASVPAHM